MTFQDMLQQVRTTCLEAFEHQELPFEKLVEELRPERDVTRQPLVQALFVLQNTEKNNPKFGKLRIQPVPGELGKAKFDLTLSMRETDKQIQGGFEYNADIFDASTIQQMLSHFQHLLMQVVAAPDQKISEMLLLDEAESHRQLVEWNDTVSGYPREHTLSQLLEAQVEQTPDAIAMVGEEQSLTYEELNGRANQLAHYLQSQGVQVGTSVGFCLDRSVEAVIVMLGIMKAGAYYVPLDPSYPSDRLHFMLIDAGVSVVLTHTNFHEKFPDQWKARYWSWTHSGTRWLSYPRPTSWLLIQKFTSPM